MKCFTIRNADGRDMVINPSAFCYATDVQGQKPPAIAGAQPTVVDVPGVCALVFTGGMPVIVKGCKQAWSRALRDAANSMLADTAPDGDLPRIEPDPPNPLKLDLGGKGRGPKKGGAA